MFGRVSALVICLLMASLAPASSVVAAAGSSDEVSGELLFSIAPAEMELLLTETGFSVLQKMQGQHWVLRSPNGYTMAMTFGGCKEGRCEGVRLRAVWPLGRRTLALAAARSYEQSAAIAHVSLRAGQRGMILLVGRDIWMLPGRTAGNIVAQLEHVDVLAGGMTQHLKDSDPGISEFWERTAPQ